MRGKILALVAAGALSAVQAASAALILPNTSIAASGEMDPVGGTVLVTTGPVAFAADGFSGTLTTTVISGDTSNPLGGLTFVYQLSNDSTSTAGLNRLSIPRYNGFATDMSFNPQSAGFAPTNVGRNLSGDSVSFTFPAPPEGLGLLAPGMTSKLLVVQTDAQAYQQTLAGVIDGAVAQVASYAPVPEPGMLSLIGLAGLAAMRRRA